MICGLIKARLYYGNYVRLLDLSIIGQIQPIVFIHVLFRQNNVRLVEYCRYFDDERYVKFPPFCM